MREFVILTIGIVFLSLYWFFTDPRPMGERIHDLLKPKRLLFYGAQLVIFVCMVINIRYYPQYALPANPFLLGLGFAFYVLGYIFLIWAKHTMSVNWNMPGQHDIKRQKQLVTTGPFAISRNPIYVGNLFLFTGFFLLTRSFFILLMPLAFLRLYQAIMQEEELLTHYFGGKYSAYKKRVPRFL